MRNVPPVRSARVHPRDVTNTIEIVRLLKTCTWLNVYDLTIKSFRKKSSLVEKNLLFAT